MTITRKEFLGQIVGVAAAAVGVAAFAGCGSDSPADAPPGGNCLMNGTNAVIQSNHGHVLTVSKADVSAGVNKTYDITGTAGHTHMVTVTAANFATLAGNASIMVTSTTASGHSHGVTVTCA